MENDIWKIKTTSSAARFCLSTVKSLIEFCPRRWSSNYRWHAAAGSRVAMASTAIQTAQSHMVRTSYAAPTAAVRSLDQTTNGCHFQQDALIRSSSAEDSQFRGTSPLGFVLKGNIHYCMRAMAVIRACWPMPFDTHHHQRAGVEHSRYAPSHDYCRVGKAGYRL